MENFLPSSLPYRSKILVETLKEENTVSKQINHTVPTRPLDGWQVIEVRAVKMFRFLQFGSLFALNLGRLFPFLSPEKGRKPKESLLSLPLPPPYLIERPCVGACVLHSLLESISTLTAARDGKFHPISFSPHFPFLPKNCDIIFQLT